MNLQIIGIIGSFTILLLGSISDLRTKGIPVFLLMAGNIGGLLCFLCRFYQELTGITMIIELVGSILPGLGLFLLSFLTGRKIGVGDGLILLSVGMFESSRMTWATLCFGLFLQSVFAILLLVLKKAKRDTRIPFVPFLLAGRIILLFL